MSSRWLGAWPAIPALLLLFVFFLYPVVRMLGFSIEGGTLDWYTKALGESLYLQVFWNTFEIAFWVTLICLLLGYPLGFLLATTTPGWATVGFIFVLLPLWTSVLVRTYAWMVLLGRNGVFNRMMLEAGLISDPVPMLNNFSGVLIGMVHVLLPYRCCRSTVRCAGSTRRWCRRPRGWAPPIPASSGASISRSPCRASLPVR